MTCIERVSGQPEISERSRTEPNLNFSSEQDCKSIKFSSCNRQTDARALPEIWFLRLHNCQQAFIRWHLAVWRMIRCDIKRAFILARGPEADANQSTCWQQTFMFKTEQKRARVPHKSYQIPATKHLFLQVRLQIHISSLFWLNTNAHLCQIRYVQVSFLCAFSVELHVYHEDVTSTDTCHSNIMTQ